MPTGSRLIPRLIPRLVLGAGCVGIAAASAIALRADLLVGYGFNRALEARKAVQPSEVTARASWIHKAEVGDEAYWLDRSSVGWRAAVDRRLTIGDHIVISGSDGRARTLEIVDLKFLGAPVVNATAGRGPLRLAQVTARIVGAGRGDGAELVRLFIEAEEVKPSSMPAPQAPVGRT